MIFVRSETGQSQESPATSI